MTLTTMRDGHLLRTAIPPLHSAHCVIAACHRQHEAQQRLQRGLHWLGKALEQGLWQLPCRHRDRDQAGSGGPTPGLREYLRPPLPPAIHRPPAHPEQLGDARHPRWRRPTAQRRDQHYHRAEVDLASQKTNRRRRQALATFTSGAAKAQAPCVVRSNPCGTPRALRRKFPACTACPHTRHPAARACAARSSSTRSSNPKNRFSPSNVAYIKFPP